MANQKKQFSNVNQLRPLDSGLNLTVKVVNSKTVAQRGRTQGHFAECLVGDETGIIIFLRETIKVSILRYRSSYVFICC
ncbi:hypothetical protein PHJA_001431100 [Phtheirospermum japonicum]|uniref:Single-stranded DNA binding protein Ssb-like OB fold domain-containing protein n=1 Tax=Phtheirospermum japonicum TaxID=374723 RepID=A0A830C751_9LAMI|nr:hypothetical protein PHJA_001431100 [Phtheirospermum japonicum]